MIRLALICLMILLFTISNISSHEVTFAVNDVVPKKQKLSTISYLKVIEGHLGNCIKSSKGYNQIKEIASKEAEKMFSR